MDNETSETNSDDILNNPFSDVEIEIETTQLTTEELQEKIKLLGTTSEGEPLAYAMRDLKNALLANPAACVNLLPTDIGAMVASLQKLVGKDTKLAELKQAKKEEKSTRPKKLTPQELSQISDEDLL